MFQEAKQVSRQKARRLSEEYLHYHLPYVSLQMAITILIIMHIMINH